MRRFWLSVAACVAASWAWAAPNPAHVPAGAAAVVVADRLDGAPSVEALLAAARREVGEDPVPFSPMRWVNPTRRWVEAVRRTVLFPEGGKVGARSFVLALCVPRAQKRDFADGIDVVAFAEGEAIDLGGLTREAEAMVAESEGRLALAQEGAWRLLRAAKPRADVPSAVLAWRAAPGGVALFVGADFAAARDLFDGKAPSLAAESPLRAAFVAPEAAKGQWLRVVAEDVAGRVERWLTGEPPEAAQTLRARFAWLTQARRIAFTAWVEEEGVQAGLTVEGVDAQAAERVREVLLGFRLLLARGILPRLLIPPYDALAAWVAQWPCAAQDGVATLGLTLPKATLTAIIREIYEGKRRVRDALRERKGWRP